MHAGAVVTHFNCTEGPLCAGDIVECNCSTSNKTLQWNISERAGDNEIWSYTIIFSQGFNDTTTENGYNFVFNKTLTTSTPNFTLNPSEIIFIECADGQDADKENTTITDSG